MDGSGAMGRIQPCKTTLLHMKRLIFISFGMVEHTLVTLKIEYPLSWC